MRQSAQLLCAVLLLPAIAAAQGERARDWEAGFHVGDYSSLSLAGFGGASLDVESNHFLDSNVTPFVEIGYGWTRVDSNILERPPITGCWGPLVGFRLPDIL